MKNFILQNKWKLAWGGFGLMLLVFIFVSRLVNIETKIIVLTIFTLLLAAYPTVLIFTQGRWESEKSNRKQLDHLQQLTKQQIDANQTMFQKQIDAITSSTKEQISVIQKSTEAQIQAIQENTNKQIEHYAKQTEILVNSLTENAVLLAEILLSQLEEKMGDLNLQLSNAQEKYRDLSGFHFLRSEREKFDQLNRQQSYINNVENAHGFVKERYKQVKNFLVAAKRKVA